MARALVTGCSKGVGFSTALALAAHGWDVVATVRDPITHAGELQSAASAAGVELAIRALDVTDGRSVSDVIGAAGPLDLLVNNAAVTQFCSVEETPIEDWQLMVDTNFLGPIRCMRAVMASMRERAHGCIINVSTVAAQAAFAGTGADAASRDPRHAPHLGDDGWQELIADARFAQRYAAPPADSQTSISPTPPD